MPGGGGLALRVLRRAAAAAESESALPGRLTARLLGAAFSFSLYLPRRDGSRHHSRDRHSPRDDVTSHTSPPFGAKHRSHMVSTTFFHYLKKRKKND